MSEKRSLFFRIRVGVLLVVLVGVGIYAIRDIRSRRERNEWERTLNVAVIVMADADVDPLAVRNLRARAPLLAAKLRAEMKRFRGAEFSPFRFEVVGPVAIETLAPSPRGDGLLDLAKYAWENSRWVSRTDDRAGVNAGAYDTRIYVTVHKPKSEDRSFIEGRSQEGGHIGTVDVELDAEMSDTALIVIAHEMFHTLGATDRYDATGRIELPDGLGDPKQVPLYPQMKAEIMARNRAVSPVKELIPIRIDELAVGEKTAGEIGWK